MAELAEELEIAQDANQGLELEVEHVKFDFYNVELAVAEKLEKAGENARKLEMEAEEKAMTCSVLTRALADSQLKCRELERELAKLKNMSKVINLLTSVCN